MTGDVSKCVQQSAERTLSFRELAAAALPATLDLRALAAYTSSGSLRNVRRLVNEPDFPAPIQLRPGARGVWKRSEVDLFIETRRRAEKRPEPESLRTARAVRALKFAADAPPRTTV